MESRKGRRLSRLIGIGALLTVAVSCGGGYEPGSVAERAEAGELELEPGANALEAGGDGAPLPRVSGFWTMPDGVEIYYEAVGRGRNVLVVHGGPGFPSAESWPAADAVGDRFRFVYYHHRGSGHSDRPIDAFESEKWGRNVPILTEALGVEAQIADIERIRKILGEEKLLLVGHSYGGFLASLYAVEFPARVERLVLIAPASVLTMPNDDSNLYEEVSETLPPDRRDAFEEWIDRYFDYGSLWQKSEADHVELNNALGPYFVYALEEYRERVRAEHPGRELWGFGEDNAEDPSLTGGWVQPAIFLSLGRRYDLRPALGRVTAPTAIFIGDSDFSTSPQAVAAYRDAIPNAEMSVLRGAGHFPQGDAGRFAQLLRGALEPGL